MQGPHPRTRTPTGRLLRRLALYVVAPALLILEIPVAVHVVQKPDLGMPVHNLSVRAVHEGGPADRAGIRPGDRLLGVDGRAVGTMVGWHLAEAGRYDLAPRDLLLQRGERFVTAVVTPVRPGRRQVIWGYGLSLAGIAFLAMGWLVFSRRHDMVTRYFYALSVTFAFFLMDVPDWPSPAYMVAKDVLRDVALLMLPVACLRFFLYFPDRTHLTPENHRRHRLLWLPALPLLVASLYVQVARLDPAGAVVAGIQQVSGVYFLAYIGAGLVIFARKVLRRDRPVAHTKLRLVLLGLLLGFVPFMVGAYLHSLAGTPPPAWSPWLVFSLVLVPVSFGLAILRYGALGLADVMRHALVYGLLTLTVVVAYGVLVGVVGRAMASRFRIGDEPMLLAAVIGTALALNPLRRRLHRWVDATFYPSRLADREAILALGHEMSLLIEDSDAPRAMLDRLHELYRPLHVALFLEDRGAHVLHALRADEPPPAGPYRVDAEATLPRVLLTAHRPVAAEEVEGLDTRAETDAQSRVILETLDVRLAVPLVTGQRLVGFLTLGPKSSGGLYTQADIRNLHDFSVQAAALVEIGRLYRQNLERERMETELAVAKRIQQNLVPTRPLHAAGVELVGRMASCREVGGDSFGYFPLDDATVGFAIADAAGKGVPAALTMTTLSAAFRTAAHTHRDPARVIETLNRHVCTFAAAGQFICFFYGTYHAPTRTLRYCNAGMNPPLLVRPGRPWVERLKKGGLVLGIDEDRRYARGVLTLQPGDVLLLYSDGFTEETDEAGEFFGEGRLERSVLQDPAQPLDALRDRIFATVEAFGGPEQSDDRTLLLLRVKELD